MSELLVPVDAKALDWPRKVANAINRLTRSQSTVATMQDVELATMDRDTSGGIVPTWKAHSFTYDGSGNLLTDTVSDGTSTWVRTYTYGGGNLQTDSGWVKQ